MRSARRARRTSRSRPATSSRYRPRRRRWCRTPATGSSPTWSASARGCRSRGSEMHRLEVVQPAPPGAFVVYPSSGALPRPSRTRDSQLREMLAVLRRRWQLVGGLAAAGLTLMAVVSLLTPRLWTARAVLHVNIQPPQVTNLPQVVTPPSYFEGVEFFQDQVKFLESRSLAARVIRELGLEHEPAFAGGESGWSIMTVVEAGVSVLLSPLRLVMPTRKAAPPEQP